MTDLRLPFLRAAGRLALACVGVCLTGWIGIASRSFADSVTIQATQDNTLYEDGENDLSNGYGQHVFIGATDGLHKRRALLRFEVASSLPEGATVHSATLQLYGTKSKRTTSYASNLYRVLASWGEGTSVARGEQGAGIEPKPNDATWFYRHYAIDTWATPGGDFAPTSSATLGVGASGATYSWSTGAMAADVQAWLNDPASDFGWVLIGEESTIRTAKRFASRSYGEAPRQPKLVVSYTPSGAIVGACCTPDGSCRLLTPATCGADDGEYRGDGTPCSPYPCGGVPVTVSADALKDNTLYENLNGDYSNGQGEYFFAGTNAGNLRRRAVLMFDLVGLVPAGGVVSNVTLKLRSTQSGGPSRNVRLHRLTAEWGEGTSDASGDESSGAPSATADATWKHTMYPVANWATLGGDFSPTVSATASIGDEGVYAWTSAQMQTDLLAWLANPSSNYGWELIGDETAFATAKRFASRQAIDPSLRPRLEITYTIPLPTPTGACCLPDASCLTLTASGCASQGGTYGGDYVSCASSPCVVALTPYVDPLPIPPVASPVNGLPGGVATYAISLVEVSRRLHRDLPETRLWTYGGQYPGPTIEASADRPVTVRWISDLRDGTGALRTQHLLPVDLCVHGPDSLGATPRTVTHLHGGHVPAASDGYPEQTILPGQQQTFVYPNHQPPATLWYHDHALGITRLNVLLGLAGFYFLRDPIEQALGLPSGAYEVPLLMQDRSFHADGSLVYPAAWEEHFFGDHALVNGKVQPYCNVARGDYRIRLLNGSNARTYALSLSNGLPFTVIGDDGGLLGKPIVRESLVISPGERYDVVVDFGGESPGAEILLLNSAAAPYPGNEGGGHEHRGAGSQGTASLPEIMKFIVGANAGFAWTPPNVLRPVTPIPESEATVSRDFILRKMDDPCTGSMWMINDRSWNDITERPQLGATEIWRFANPSGTVHPMHLHLVRFQVLDRQPILLLDDTIVPTGPAVPPDSSMAGWKDTVPVLPNEAVRVIARFDDYLGRFAYHCHILEHEDQEMMRQFEVVDTTTASGGGPDIGPSLQLLPPSPNPAIGAAQLSFEVPAAIRVRLEIFDVAGRLVATPFDEFVKSGRHTVRWDGRDARGRRVVSGAYCCVLTTTGRARLSRKLLLLE